MAYAIGKWIENCCK